MSKSEPDNTADQLAEEKVELPPSPFDDLCETEMMHARCVTTDDMRASYNKRWTELMSEHAVDALRAQTGRGNVKFYELPADAYYVLVLRVPSPNQDKLSVKYLTVNKNADINMGPACCKSADSETQLIHIRGSPSSTLFALLSPLEHEFYILNSDFKPMTVNSTNPIAAIKSDTGNYLQVKTEFKAVRAKLAVPLVKPTKTKKHKQQPKDEPREN